MRLFQQEQLPRKEIPEVEQLLVAADRFVGVLFEGQFDVDPNAEASAGAAMSGPHDAAPGTGDHHPAGLGHQPAELHGAIVVRHSGLGSSGAEDRDLASSSIRGEDLEGSPQLLERRVSDLEVHALSAI